MHPTITTTTTPPPTHTVPLRNIQAHVHMSAYQHVYMNIRYMIVHMCFICTVVKAEKTPGGLMMLLPTIQNTNK